MTGAFVVLVCVLLFMAGKYLALITRDLFHAGAFAVAELVLLASYLALSL
jgi:hypothetical protein